MCCIYLKEKSPQIFKLELECENKSKLHRLLCEGSQSSVILQKGTMRRVNSARSFDLEGVTPPIQGPGLQKPLDTMDESQGHVEANDLSHPRDILECPIGLTCKFLVRGTKPENPTAVLKVQQSLIHT